MRNDSSPDVAASEAEDERSVTAVADEPAVIRERAPDVQPGDLLAGRYQIEAVIGKGGSGVVLRAFDRVSATVVAVKVLKPGLTHDPRWEKRFQRELRIGRPIQHPNVCRIFDIGDADGYRFLTMEFATGGTLRDLIKKNEPLRPLSDRLADAAGVIAGLSAIHGAGIVHRDVKPDNMLRMEDGRLALSDFGLATDLPDSTMVSVFVGTPHYMAPEVREGDPATTRSDVWSLGVVLHEIFFGRRPERRNSRSGASGPGTPTTKTSPAIERAMLALCAKCLADDPADRPADAAATWTLFERARSSPRGALSRPRDFRLRTIAVLGLLAFGLMGAAIYRKARAPVAVAGAASGALHPVGEPADWSKIARSVTTMPGRVHCFSLVDSSTARIVWGKPRRAEDVDLATGARRAAGLLPETYATGCPQLSPDGASLLFDATTAAGATEIRLSNRRDGGLAKTITPGAEPVWLRNGQEFLYDLDPSHAAVFSLPTMSFILLSDPGLGGHQMIAEKAASPNADALALLLVDEKAQWAASVYEGRGFEHRRTYSVPPGFALQFDPRSQHLLIPFNQSASISTLTSLDWQHGQLKHVGHYPGLEIANVKMVAGAAIVLARRRLKDAWLIAGSQRKRLTKEGQIFSAAISVAGELLLSKQAADGTMSIWLHRLDGSVERVTNGPDDVRPNFSPDGQQWTYVDYSRKSVMLCANKHGGCTVLRYDEMLPAWPTFSPDGRKIAYVTQMGTPRLLTVSLQDGKTEQIGPMHTQCPPVWSSPTSIWSLEGAAKQYRWVERDVENAAATGHTIHLDGDGDINDGRCWPDVSDSRSPFFRRVQVETEETSTLLSLDSLPQMQP